MFIKIALNYYKILPDYTVLAYGAGNTPQGIGSWFNCNEETTERLRALIDSGQYKEVKSIPRNHCAEKEE